MAHPPITQGRGAGRGGGANYDNAVECFVLYESDKSNLYIADKAG